MNIDILKKAGINYEEGLGRFMGNNALYEKFIKKFPADENYSLACEDMKSGDMKALLAHTHAMKGTTGNLSMNTLYGSCCNIVDAIRAEQFDKCPEIFEEITANYNTVLEAIKEAE